jgi:uncharacterized protein with HEPN domain
VVKLLEDVRDAGALIQSYLASNSEAEYLADIMLRDAVHRRFEVIGEALRRLRAEDPNLAARIAGLQQVVDFRNVLAHGYDEVDDRRVWRIAHSRLPALVQEVTTLLDEELQRE